MAVTFVLGRAGSGKTRLCLDSIASALREPAAGERLILLVPEQASFQMEMGLSLRAPGFAFSRADVLSFSRLAQRWLAEAGREPALLSREARSLALRAVAAAQRDALDPLGRAADAPGFYAELNRLIEELLAQNIEPDAFAAAGAALPDRHAQHKAAALAALYREYVARHGSGWSPAAARASDPGIQRAVDPALRLALLRTRLDELNWLREARVWVDGFAGFTGQEQATLIELARRVRQMHLTLLLDPDSPAAATDDDTRLFARTEKTYARLRDLLARAGVPVVPPLELRAVRRVPPGSALAVLECQLAAAASAAPPGEPGETGDQRDGFVQLRACPTPRDEVRAAARFIRARIADSGGALRFRDFALITRDLEPLAGLIREVFDEFDIPHFLDRRRAMGPHPLCRLVRGAFDALESDCSAEAMTLLLRTELLPMERADAEDIENLVLAAEIRGWDLWTRPTWRELVGDFALPGAAAIARLDAARLRVTNALRRLREMRAAPAGGSSWAEAIAACVAELGAQRRIAEWIDEARATGDWEAAEAHRLAWEALTSVLDDLHEILHDLPLTLEQAADTLAGALAGRTLGLAPPTLDQVLVSSIERSRHPEIQFAWLLAFNEGVFPAPPPAETILSVEERAALVSAGLDLAASRQDDALAESLLAYIAFTRPARGLVISYAESGDDGQKRLPSPLLADVRRACPALREMRERGDEAPACLSEYAWLILDGALPARLSPQRRERLFERIASDAPSGERLRLLLRGRQYANDVSPLGRPIVIPRGDAAVWEATPSQIETYLRCPFQFFATYGLRIRARRGPEPLAWALGSAQHAILARVTQRAIERHADVRSLADADWTALLDEAVSEHLAAQPADLALCRPELDFRLECLRTALADVLFAQVERWRRGQWRPLLVEWRFLLPSGADGLDLPAEAGPAVALRGQLDRVDVAQSAAGPIALVYDYKPHAKAVRGPWLSGHTLQILLYSAALRAAVARGEAPDALRQARVAGALLAPLRPEPKALAATQPENVPPDEKRMRPFLPRGAVTAEAAGSLDPRMKPGANSPVIACRITKGGEFYKRGCDVVAEPLLSAMIDTALTTAAQAATGAVAGKAEIVPLVERRKLACAECELAALCRFDRAYNTAREASRCLPIVPLAEEPEPEE